MKHEPKPDKNEILIRKKEEKLNDEIQEVQAKNEEITLIYDKVKANLKNVILKSPEEKKLDDTNDVNNTTVNETQNNQETRNETTDKQTEEGVEKAKEVNEEDELVKNYFDFLKRTKKNLTDVFLSVKLILIIMPINLLIYLA